MSSIKISGKELTNASIIQRHDHGFETVVQTILKGSEEELTPDESVKVTGLDMEWQQWTRKKRGQEKKRDADAELSLAEKALSEATMTSCVHNDFSICVHGFTFH
ncbi:hypothetical protein IV203_015726 [Nitzschia inconspicua]|uniref:Uncharacterized protein n=1 Tax=Nitzschia inconspicua TaxID=303405 RepID=A0A9K3LBG5_9STRA|nr:hypothetical protein IV203_015726 [Nitzschia inconspicua]